MATAIAFTVPIRQVSPLFIARRDFAISGGDDIVLQLTVRETDGGAVVDVTDAQTTFRAIRPSGGELVMRKEGIVSNGPTGRIDVTLDSFATLQLMGSYFWAVKVVLEADRTFTTVRGVMQVQEWLGEAVSGDALEGTDGYILTETGDYIQVEN